MDEQPSDRVLKEFQIEFLDSWRRLPNKGFFLVLLAAWLALFHFLGNSARGYAPTSSLMGWMYIVFNPKGGEDSTGDIGNWVPLLVLVLFWWRRKTLLATEPKLWAPGLLLVGMGLAIHMAGYVVQQPTISIVGLFTGLYGLMGLAWGPAWLRASFFPFFLFAFMIPLGSLSVPITFRLRVWVCQIVEGICGNVFAFDIVREGTALKNPAGNYQYDVAAACSGIRSLTATAAVALIYAWISFSSWWKRGLLIASAFPLAVFGNVVRLLTIIVAAEFWGQEAGNTVHEGGWMGIFSLLPYIPAFAGLLLLGRWLQRGEDMQKRDDKHSSTAEVKNA
jgi:exosortase